MTRESAATPSSSTKGGSGRPVIAVLCGQASERPQFDGLEAEFRYCAADGLAEAARGGRALLLWGFFFTAARGGRCGAASLEWIPVPAARVESVLFHGVG